MNSTERNEHVASGPERQRVEEALREREEKFRIIADYTADWENWIGPDGKLLWVSPSVERVTGYSVSEFRAMHGLSMPLSAEEDREVVRAQFQRAMAGTREIDQEFRFVHKDGTTRWGSVSWQPIFASDGTPLGHRSSIRDITRRKRMEEALRQSEGNFKALAENAHDGMLIGTGEESRHVYANRRAADITGYSIEELLNTRMRDLARPDELPKLAERYEKRLAGLEVEKPYETVLIRKDGIEIPVEISPSKTIWKNEPADLVVFRDITARKQAEAALRENEANLAALIENTEDRIWAVDADYRLIVSNRQFLHGIEEGLKRKIALGESVLLGSLPQAMQNEWCSYYDRALRGETFSIELAMRFSEKPRYMDYRFHPVRAAYGKISGVVVSGRDITERKRAEAALRESEARLRALFENSLVGILLTAVDGRVFAANPAACRLFGRTEADICRLGRAGLVDRRDSRVNVFVQERAEKGYAVGEMTLVRADGTCFPAQVASVVFETAEGPRTSMVIQDLSERKLAEDRIRDFTRKLLSVREEEKRRFSAVLHHDVGSFTVGVTARLNAVEDDLRAGEKQKALAALKACRRLFAQSVRRLRTLAVELRPPDLDILGLAATLREHFRLVTRETSLKIHFTDATRGAAISPGTQTVLFRTLQECLNNTVRHAHARRVRVRLSVLRKTLRLSITDDGKGFDPARSAAKPGTHLGLQAIQEMVASLGGNVVVESAARHGATVRIAIPQEGPPP